MAKHEVTYDGQGIALTDPWDLDDYLHADGLSAADRELVRESVLSWLREYDSAGCDLREAMSTLTTTEEGPT